MKFSSAAKIYTLTLSPAYDIHAWADALELDKENLVHLRSREAGGKGVNISRALHSAAVPNTAIILAGSENDGEFRDALQALSCRYLSVPGRIRENLTIHVAGSRETRISYPGFPVDPALLAQVEDLIEVDGNTIVTFTGRVPDGISKGSVKAFLLRLKEKGAKLVVDSKSFCFEDICQIGPWLIKPNQEELGEFLGCTVDTLAQAAEKGQSFFRRGVENVMLSMGSQGAALICKDGVFTAAAPNMEAVSTIGAGDSALAGFIAAFAQGKTPEQCLRSAVAFGSAACLTPGSQPPREEDILRFLE